MKRKQTFTLLLIIISLLMINLTVSARGSQEVQESGDAGAEPVVAQVVTEEPKALEAADASYPPAGWVTDIREAYQAAQAGDKRILINFTGSDWCVWCKKLSKEVFSTDRFQAYADTDLVLLFLDFPNGIELPDEQIYHNQLIAQLMNVKGYPAIWLLDKDFNPLMATGYMEGGADAYIRHLEEDLPDVSPEERENFRRGFTEAIEANIGPLK